MKKKEISEMTNNEILRQQLELLAEVSEKCFEEHIASVTDAMISLYNILEVGI